MKKLTLLLACLMVFASVATVFASANDVETAKYTAKYAATKPTVYGDSYTWDTAWEIGEWALIGNAHDTNHGTTAAPKFKVLHDDTNIYLVAQYADTNVVGDETLAIGIYGTKCAEGCDANCTTHKEIMLTGAKGTGANASMNAYTNVKGVWKENLTSVSDGEAGFRFKSVHQNGTTTWEVRIPKAYIGNVSDTIGMEITVCDNAIIDGSEVWNYENFTWASPAQRNMKAVLDPANYATVKLATAEESAAVYTAAYAEAKPSIYGDGYTWDSAWSIGTWSTVANGHNTNHASTAAPAFKILHDDKNIYVVVVYGDNNGTTEQYVDKYAAYYGSENLIISLKGTVQKEYYLITPAAASGSASMHAYAQSEGAWVGELSSKGNGEDGFRYKSLRNGTTVMLEARIPKADLGEVGDSVLMEITLCDVAAGDQWNYENYTWSGAAVRNMANVAKTETFGTLNLAAKPVHVHTEETTTGYAATCTETGLTDGVVCSECGETLVAQQEIAALGHTAGEWQYDDEGHWTECTVCGEIADAKAAHAEEGTCVCGKEIVATVYELIDDQIYADGELVAAYKTYVVDGKTYFVGDYNKIVKDKAVYVDGAWMPFGADGALTTEKVVLPISATTLYAFENGARSTTLYGLFETADATYYVGDGYCVVTDAEAWVKGTYWYFDATGAKATGTVLFNDRVYVEGEWLRAYAVVNIDGNWYKVSDYHKIAKNISVYINNPEIGAPGYYNVGADGIIEINA